MKPLADQFLLNQDVIFLNHGSFGATPRLVLENYQFWQRELENQPVHFIVHELLDHLKQARNSLGGYLHANADDLVFIPNATFGINIVARSLDLRQSDEILTSNHEYGACDNIWTFMCQKTGSSYNHLSIPLPVKSSIEIADQFWSHVSSQTKVIFLSHITSPTAVRFPIEEICKRAREAGIYTVIDGAHAPGQISLNLGASGADFYIGNCHKWMLGPKGSGFLYARRDIQHLVEPLVVSWGWGDNSPYTTGSDFIDKLEWLGTNDPSAFLAVPASIQFMKENNWPAVQKRCNKILVKAIRQICELTGLTSIYPDDSTLFYQMAIVPLPPLDDLPAFQAHLYRDFRIEVPCIQWNEKQFMRISIQGYNTWSDIEVLLGALKILLPKFIRKEQL